LNGRIDIASAIVMIADIDGKLAMLVIIVAKHGLI
jgi:hypothetical protein